MIFNGHVVNGKIEFDAPIPLANGTEVVVLPTEKEPSTAEAMQLVQESGALDFWNDPAEDVYTDKDGEPA